jgi:uncharacterized protein
MPYFIADNDPDCDGWAVVKDDGERFGCHTTKEGAIQQMVAISLSEDVEPGGEYQGTLNRAAPDALKVGDFVRWQSSGGTARGKITRIERDGGINVPDTEFTITGTEDDPAALIRIYRAQDGGWEPIDTLVGHKFSTLTKIEPLMPPTGKRALPDNYRPATSDDVPEGRACGNCVFFNEDNLDDEGRAFCEKWEEYVAGGQYCNAWEPREQNAYDKKNKNKRAVNLEPPSYMRAAARQGLKYHEEGKSGGGLVDRTVREARAMAQGNVTADKWVRIRAWIARHLVDLDRPQASPGHEDYPSPGVVAHLLWGSGPSKQGAQRTLEYAEGVIARLEAENKDRARGMAVQKLETRYNWNPVEFEVRETADGMTFEGYAALFNQPSEPLPFIERIAPGAFLRSLKTRNEIKLLWNHDTSEVLGSKRAGTLRMVEDDRGLRVTADLPNTSTGRDAAELLRRGDVDSMSFGFSVPKGGDEWSADGSERTLREIKLHEVSIVAFPAYTSTAGTTSVRGLDKVAERANVDGDALADALLKLETGDEITAEDKDLLSRVLDILGPEDQPAVVDDKAFQMLALKKKKLELLKGY